MIPAVREEFNQKFTSEKYEAFLDLISERYNHRPPFRVAESPVFIPKLLKKRLIEACEDINELLCQPNFKSLVSEAIKLPQHEVPGEDYHTRFLQMDFGICLDEEGNPTPQLIEVQGFPSLYFFQDMLASAHREIYDIPEGFTVHVNNINRDQYVEMLREIIVGDSDPKHVALLEIEPEKQNTYVDFLGAEDYLGIKILCITKLKKEGKRLFYLDDNDEEITIEKIYNRVIFDELELRDDLEMEFSFSDEVDVEWVGHPNWFFRVSKYIMPLLDSQYVPKCYYLDQLDEFPGDLENYVLKPLYSFAGSGVRLNITQEELAAIPDKENFILQRRVNYEPVIQSTNEPVKCEIRMLMLWNKGDERPVIVNNLARLSKGAMIGVKFNKDKDWVGASVGFFEKD